jgi:tetratricopeptide (TPR) repeat protein
VIVMVMIVHDLMTRAISSRTTRIEVGTALLTAFLIALGITSIMRIQDYRTEESIWRAALEAVPHNDVAHAGLGYALLNKGSHDAALEAFEQARLALKIHGNNIPALMLAGRAASKAGDYPTAIEYYTMGFRATSGHGWGVRDLLTKTRTKHALQLLESNQPHEAARQFQAALEVKRDFLIPLTALARLRATHPDSTLRNGTEALDLAKRACKLTGYQEPAILDTLATAYAENGEFEKAIEVQKKSLDLLTTTGRNNMLNNTRYRLDLYRNGKPFRMNVGQMPIPHVEDSPHEPLSDH